MARTIALNVRKHLKTGQDTHLLDAKYGWNAQKKNSRNRPSYTRFCTDCFWAFRNSTCYNNHTANNVCINSESCANCGRWFVGPVSEHRCHTTYCSYCSKIVKADHKCYVEVMKKKETKTLRYVFYDFECTPSPRYISPRTWGQLLYRNECGR